MMLKKIGMTKKEFEIIEDVLSEIEESRVYENEDKIALDNLKEYFSYANYKAFCSSK
jgi:hypothetical protein